MTRTEEVREIITSYESLNLMVLFRAKAGERNMLCRFDGSGSLKSHLLTVHDVAKDAMRSINLSTTFRIVDPDTGEVLFDQPLEENAAI